MRSRRSIRARITMLAALVVAAVMVALALVVVLVQQAQLQANLDNTLEQRADQIEAQLLAEPGVGLVNTNAEDRFAQVLDAGGGVLFATDNVTGVGALAELPDGDQEIATRSDIPIEDDRYRVLIHRFRETSGDRYVVVGENVDDLVDTQRALIATFSIVIPIVIAVLGALVWWLVGRTLRPVEEIRSEVARIGLDQLDRRVAVPGTGDEIARLATTMNEMLARLQVSSALQRRFVADASHELRTPLTRLRTRLEVELALEDRDLAEVGRRVLADVVELQQLVDDLLFLARRDAGTIAPPTERLDLDVIVDEEVRRQRDASPGVTIDMSSVSAAAVLGDDGQLARLVRNLLVNAARHARSRVAVSVADTPTGPVLTVDDDGPGIRPADRERIFERFVRLDEARSGRHGGSGLGLAIARDIAAIHGASLSVGDSTAGGACFAVRFPRTESWRAPARVLNGA